MSDPIIDLPEVMERVQEDKELLVELFGIFTEDYRQKSGQLKAAVSTQDFEMIKEVVHSIKGAAGNISAKLVHNVCKNIEQLALAKNIAGVEQAVPLLDAEFKKLQVRMAEIKKQFGH